MGNTSLRCYLVFGLALAAGIASHLDLALGLALLAAACWVC